MKDALTGKKTKYGVVSFPKCGRTWIRLFLAYYVRDTGIKTFVSFRHDNKVNYKKRILMIRNPCDVMVSLYFHYSVRRHIKTNISKFIRGWRGIPLFNSLYETWSEREDNQLVVRYEDMFSEKVWVDMLEFFDIPIHKEAFDNAIENTKFDNIRNSLDEIKKLPSSWRYLAAQRGNYNIVHPDNPEAHKFRRGKVDGYVDYLDDEDIGYIRDNFTLGKSLANYTQRYMELIDEKRIAICS